MKKLDQLEFKDGMDLEVLERMQTEDPIAVYIKTIRAKLGVIVFNPHTRRPEERILEGDTEDPKADVDKMTVKIWTPSAHNYFLSVNKRLIEEGMLVPYDPERVRLSVNIANAITEQEIEEILDQPFFTLKNKLEELTSSVAVERVLRKALEMNRPVGTIQHIKERLNTLQEAEGLDFDTERIDKYFRNLEV